jgi:hypothetical protein
LKTPFNHSGAITLDFWRVLRTGALIAGAAFASVSMVNLPTPSWASTTQVSASAYVPAADKWITLGSEAAEVRASIPSSSVEELSDSPLAKEPRPQRKPRGLQLASLGGDAPPPASAERSLSVVPVRWSASSGCLNATLRQVLAEVGRNFGSVTVNSTCRSRQHNAKVGGAPRSLHLSGDAVDFRTTGETRAVLAFLGGHRALGGLKHYADGHFHIDTGPRRSW